MYACVHVRVGTRVATVSYRGRGYIPVKAVMPAPIWLARHRQEPSHESPVIDMRPHSEREICPRGKRDIERGREKEREKKEVEEEEEEGSAICHRARAHTARKKDEKQKRKGENKMVEQQNSSLTCPAASRDADYFFNETCEFPHSPGKLPRQCLI